MRSGLEATSFNYENFDAQEILADGCRRLGGDDVILNSRRVIDYEETTDPATGRTQVTALTAEGEKFIGDILIGADGIRSRIRHKLVS